MKLTKEKYNRVLKEFNDSRYSVLKLDGILYNKFMDDLYAYINEKWSLVVKPQDPQHPVEVF